MLSDRQNNVKWQEIKFKFLSVPIMRVVFVSLTIFVRPNL